MIAGLGLLGRQQSEDYIDVDGVKYPLPRKPAGLDTLEEWDLLRTTPLEPFQAAAVLGDDTLISDDRISSAVFNNFAPGIGVRRYNEIEGINGITDGDLLTVEGFLTTPPYRESMGTLPVAPGIYWKGYELDPTGQYTVIAWEPTVGRPYVWNSVALAWETLTNPPTLIGPVWSAFAKLGRYYIYCYPQSIWYSTDGKTWTQGWTPGGSIILQGVVEHDGKVYVAVNDQAVGTNTLIFRWVATEGQLTAGVGVAWPGVSAAALPWNSGRVFSLVDWRDRNTDDPMIYFNDVKNIYGYNDSDFFTTFWPIPFPHNSYAPQIFVFPRDRNLYFVNGRNHSVLVLNPQGVVDEVGPDKGFGLSQGTNLTYKDFSMQILAGNTRNMFAWGRPNDANGQGRLFVANDSFGWSPLARGRHTDNENLEEIVSANEQIRGMFYAGGQGRVYLARSNGAVEYIYWPDEPFTSYRPVASVVPPGRHREPGMFWAISGEFDAGNEDAKKLLKYFKLILERQATGAYGLMSTGQVKFKYAINGGAWSSATTLTSADLWPNVLPIPSLADQRGTEFRKLQWAVGVQGSNLATTYETPIVRGVVVGLTREPDIYDGLQCVIDLSDARWRDEEGNPIKEFYGRDRKELRALIETLKSGPSSGTKRHYPVTIGANGQVKSYASCDIRVSASTDPNTDFGKFTFTMRALDAPPSG